MLIRRHATPLVARLAKGFRVIAINGPRQSGKTTLARMCFPGKPYFSFEDPDQLETATRDPRQFLANLPDGAIIDEAQHFPELFSYLQGVVDEAKKPGMFVLTGSQQFGLMTGITQSLAGRVGLVTLLSLSLDELTEGRHAPGKVDELMFHGMFPALYDHAILPLDWYRSHEATYVERDVRQLINVRELSQFRRFVRMCAGRTGQLLNLSGLASDCGITQPTAKAWLSVLEASYLVHLLPPHHANFNKRLVKAPKLYFLDVGLAVWLLEIKSPAELQTHYARGALFETWVISEMLKQRYNAGEVSNLYFWRDRSGNEIDVLYESRARLWPVEIKSGTTLNTDFFAGLKRWRSLAGKKAGTGTLVYGGEAAMTREETRVVPWSRIGLLAKDND